MTVARRRLLAAAGIAAPALFMPRAARGAYRSPSDRPRIGCIGLGGRGAGVSKIAAEMADVVAVCDADLAHAERAKATFAPKADVYQDYRRLLDRKDVDAVINGTPDHWHTRINVDACRSGRDVYTEKPLSLTIAEGQLLREVVQSSGRVVQVGTQQRSVPHFRKVVEMVRGGRIGRLKQVVVMLPFWTTKSGPHAAEPVPQSLDWDLWQGQAPERPYARARTHFTYRWWSIYAGGIVTDWGQHHMDIAQWGLGAEQGGPEWVEAKAHFPNAGKPEHFDNPDRFVARMGFGAVELLYLVVRDGKYRQSMAAGDISAAADAALFADVPDEWRAEQRNGIMFVGSEGRLFVNRGGAYGRAYEELPADERPPAEKGSPENAAHLGDFFEAARDRRRPRSAVDEAHRVITSCHLTNVAIRVGRRIRWDAAAERIVGDDEAAASMYVRREGRRPWAVA